ncbi:MAG TPA: response regulator transcription factor [Candidatus Sulfotelmatobacter sp.]|nr:response regulator transcription factor [Candidatus Sulfotelmatobacter sp.]
MVRIFLVEDNVMIRTHLRQVLENTKGWAVVGEAENGRSALEKWDAHSPHVTVMDFVMPEMDGLRAGRSLSRKHPESPVLMVTIDPSRQLEQEAKKAGIKGLCQKTDVRSILKAVEALLQGGTYFQREVVGA